MAHYLTIYKKKQMLKEAIQLVMNELLNEQANPLDNILTDPNAATAPAAPGMDPNAGMGVNPMDPGTDPTAAAMDPEEAMGDEAEETEDSDEEKIPEDKSQGVVDDVIEAMETNTKNINELVNTAKASLQNYDLLNSDKKYQALSVVEKLREEDIPELNSVAAYLEKFLLGI